ncbi:MAG: LptF/LptG family permease [Flavobacteriales bacterium]|nr:LptF/LptG family permease [Flavobacteriales bacterium]
MKRLHRLVLSAYVGPLVVTFVIVLFILSMQFLWKYVDDLMGKGLPWYTLTELMIMRRPASYRSRFRWPCSSARS